MADRVLVAVIDSGVHPDHPHIMADRLRPGFAIGSDGVILEQGAIPLDRLGHGTAVTAAIQEKAPEADILPIRVFHDALRGSALALVTAIDIAASQGATIINLSLGTTNVAHAPLFATAISRRPMLLFWPRPRRMARLACLDPCPVYWASGWIGILRAKAGNGGMDSFLPADTLAPFPVCRKGAISMASALPLRRPAVLPQNWPKTCPIPTDPH
jgi:hypothetical protein